MKNQPEKKTILHIIDTLAYGGAQQLLRLSVVCSSAKYSHVVCSLQPHGSSEQAVKIHGAEVICLNRTRPSIFNPHRFIAYAYRNFRDILRLCRRQHISILHCHLSDAEFIGIPAGCFYGVDTILSTVHVAALFPQRSRWSFRNFLRCQTMKLLYSRVDHVIAVSEEVAHGLKHVFGVSPSKITTIINRIDTQRYETPVLDDDLAARLNRQPGQRFITTVARFDPLKGHTVLLESAHLLKGQRDGLRFVLAGDGSERSHLVRLCGHLGLEDTVIFLGTCRNVPALLAATDLFVLPSLSEGTSLALMEAMAAGRAIIATDIPGNAALLENGKNALLVPPGNAGALAEAIAFLLDHPETAAAYGRKARELVRERFNIRQSMAELEKLWG
jgi:L-malate glycosyltransferase